MDFNRKEVNKAHGRHHRAHLNNVLTRHQLDPQEDSFDFVNQHELTPPRLCNNHCCRIFMSEFIGTFILVYLGQSTLASLELTGTSNDTVNRQLATILTYGLAFLFAILLTLNLSGAHLNPAFTLASACFGYLKCGRVFTYLSAQYSGAFVAAIFLHATYSDKLAQRHSEGLLTGMNATLRAHGNILSTGKLFSSYPPTEVSLTQLSISYTLATTFLMFILLSIHRSSKLMKMPRWIKPIYMALTLVSIQAAFIANGGPVLNPAQDFSPRLYISMFGWGSSAFNLYHYNYWWLCGLVSPHLGALIGFGLHQVISHLNKIPEDEEKFRQHPSARNDHQQHQYTLSNEDENLS